MIYDTVALAIPIKHVHAPGKCNKAMSSILRKHRAPGVDKEETELAENLIEEMDSMTEPTDGDVPTDPRWDELKKLTDNN